MGVLFKTDILVQNKLFSSGVSNAWRKIYRQSRKYLKFNLHVTNPFLVGSLSLWHKSYSTLRMIDTAELSKVKIN